MKIQSTLAICSIIFGFSTKSFSQGAAPVPASTKPLSEQSVSAPAAAQPPQAAQPTQKVSPAGSVSSQVPDPTRGADPQLAAARADALGRLATQFILQNKSYLIKNLQSGIILDDGFPIGNEKFNFSAGEMQNLENLDAVKVALKRENHRLTKIFMEEHIVFKNYAPNVIEKKVSEINTRLDSKIDETPNFLALNTYSFDNLRSYLMRISSFELASTQLELKNPKGVQTKDGEVAKIKPNSLFDYLGLVSMVLNLAVIVYLVIKRK